MNRKSIIRRVRFFARHEDGGALAELAILVPFLILMLAAVTELGRFFQAYTTVAKSTRTAARYLSNHAFPTSQDEAINLAVCGKLVCAGGDALVPGLTAANICIESTGAPIETVTVSIPRTASGCGAPLPFQPVFNIGALLKTGVTFTPNINPSVTMYYMID
jgi:hypothetical protein